MQYRKLNVGTFNVRGLAKEQEKTKLADDMKKYDIQVLGIQEHHIVGESIETIKSSDGKEEYDLFLSGSGVYEGVGFAVSKNLHAEYRAINGRICKIALKLEGNRKMTAFSAYAPTLEKTTKKPEDTENFYDTLQREIGLVPNREICFILGDMNAKTGSEHRKHPEIVGKYGKGMCNVNGEHLIDLCEEVQLTLTNTCFKHKMCHRSTWTCPEKKNNPGRKNPYRNQIDYII